MRKMAQRAPFNFTFRCTVEQKCVDFQFNTDNDVFNNCILVYKNAMEENSVVFNASRSALIFAKGNNAISTR